MVVWDWCWWWRFGCWQVSFENGGEAMFAGWGCGGKGVKTVTSDLRWRRLTMARRSVTCFILCLRVVVVDGSGGRKAKVVGVCWWLFGSDVGGGDLVVVGIV